MFDVIYTSIFDNRFVIQLAIILLMLISLYALLVLKPLMPRKRLVDEVSSAFSVHRTKNFAKLTDTTIVISDAMLNELVVYYCALIDYMMNRKLLKLMRRGKELSTRVTVPVVFANRSIEEDIKIILRVGVFEMGLDQHFQMKTPDWDIFVNSGDIAYILDTIIDPEMPKIFDIDDPRFKHISKTTRQDPSMLVYRKTDSGETASIKVVVDKDATTPFEIIKECC